MELDPKHHNPPVTYAAQVNRLLAAIWAMPVAVSVGGGLIMYVEFA